MRILIKCLVGLLPIVMIFILGGVLVTNGLGAQIGNQSHSSKNSVNVYPAPGDTSCAYPGPGSNSAAYPGPYPAPDGYTCLHLPLIFNGAEIHYSISGKITTDGSTGAEGVDVSDNQGHSTTTDGNGNYSFGELSAGAYVITPTMSGGYTFTPATRELSLPPSAINQDFVLVPPEPYPGP